MFSPIPLSGGGEHRPEPKRHLDLKSNFLEKFQIGFTIGSFILGREGGFQTGPTIGSFILGREGGFKLGPLLAVSFWGGREGEGGGTSAGRSVNFDSFSEIGYRSP